jgi:hypothetical protein
VGPHQSSSSSASPFSHCRVDGGGGRPSEVCQGPRGGSPALCDHFTPCGPHQSSSSTTSPFSSSPSPFSHCRVNGRGGRPGEVCQEPSGSGPALCSTFLNRAGKQAVRTRHTHIEQATEASTVGSPPWMRRQHPPRAWRVAAIPASPMRGSHAGPSVDRRGSAEQGRSPPAWSAAARGSLCTPRPAASLAPAAVAQGHVAMAALVPGVLRHPRLRPSAELARAAMAGPGARRAPPWVVAELRRRSLRSLGQGEHRREGHAGSGRRWRLRQGGGRDRCKWLGAKQSFPYVGPTR